MIECKHNFVYDESSGEAICKNCGYVVTKEDKRAALEHSLELMAAEETAT